MRAIDADGHIVLGLAGHSAGVATDAGSIVDDKAIIHLINLKSSVGMNLRH